MLRVQTSWERLDTKSGHSRRSKAAICCWACVTCGRLISRALRPQKKRSLSSSCAEISKVSQKPFARGKRGLFQRARLFKQVCRPRNDENLMGAAELLSGDTIEANNVAVVSADDQ